MSRNRRARNYGWLWRIAGVLLIMAALALSAVIVPVARDYFGLDDVYANPNKCPPGQEKASGCVWAQHRVTGNCQWLPANSNAQAWNPVPDNTCPDLVQPVEASATAVLHPTWTLMPRPTDTRWPTQTQAASPVPSLTAPPDPKDPIPTLTSQAPVTVIQAQPSPVFVLTLTPRPCDLCRIEQEKADAEQEKAHAASTLAAVEAARLAHDLGK